MERKIVLIIEDNTEIRENTAELLELNDYCVLTAENGLLGFALAKQYLPDLILCDIMMPETDGRQFLKLAKEDIDLNRIPLILFSAGSSFDIQKELTATARTCLKKPFSEEELLLTISRDLAGVNSSTTFVSSKII